MQLKTFGRLPSGKRLERIKKSPHYVDGRFQNLEETEMMAKGVSYPALMFDFFFRKPGNREPSITLPSVRTDLKTTREEPSIIWFGHSSYLITVSGKNTLVDPVFSERASPMQFAGSKHFEFATPYSVDDFPFIDLLIITHDHYDHLDYNSIRGLRSKVGLICTSLGVGEHLVSWGIDESQIMEFDWWENALVLPRIELTATPSRHFSGRGLKRFQTLWSSFVLQADGLRIFIGGDSGYDGSFRKIGEQFGPFNLAILECGQYNERWPYIHMVPEQTVKASMDLKSDVLMPVHWGKFSLSLHPWNEPIRRAATAAEQMKVRITTPVMGERLNLLDISAGSRWWE